MAREEFVISLKKPLSVALLSLLHVFELENVSFLMSEEKENVQVMLLCHYISLVFNTSASSILLHIPPFGLVKCTGVLLCDNVSQNSCTPQTEKGFQLVLATWNANLVPKVSLSVPPPPRAKEERPSLLSLRGQEREILGTSLLKKPLLCNPLHPEQIATVWMSLSGNKPTQSKTSLYMGPKKLMESQKTTPDRN